MCGRPRLQGLTGSVLRGGGSEVTSRSRAPRIHDGLDLLRPAGESAREALETDRPDPVVVFDAEADPLASQVHPRLDRQGLARLKGKPPVPGGVRPVDVLAQVVAEAVGVELVQRLQRAIAGDATEGARPVKLDHPLLHVLQAVDAGVGAARGQLLALEGEGVELPLAEGEPSVDRDGSRQVRRPALAAGADVHDEQVPVGEDAVVAGVVRVHGVRARRHDVGEGLAVRPLALDDALDHGLDVALAHPWAHRAHDLEQRRRRDPHRLTDRLLPRERRRAGTGAGRAVTPASAERGGDKSGPREPEPCDAPGGGWGHACLRPECTPHGSWRC